MFSHLSRRALAAAVFWMLSCAMARADALDTAAHQAFIVDFNTGAVLFEKNADQPMTPSSMSKLMTIYLVFARLKDGSLAMNDLLPVSETAWKKHYKSEGSLMFLPVHSMAKVEDLLRGVIIQSGNDACSVLAEGVSGSEESFADLETRVGREIGLTNSVFKNASGWPEPGHVMTARDLATLSVHIIRDFPEYYPIFGERSYTYNNIKQDNRNPLIWQNVAGADGLKTGHTDDGGYGLTASVTRDGRRIVMVLNGLTSIKQRAEESNRLIEWAFREFEDVKLFRAGETVAEAEVWQGSAPTVALIVNEDVIATVRRSSRRDDVKVTTSFDKPIPAPITKGSQVGTLTVAATGFPEIKMPLVAAADVEKLGLLGRIGAAIRNIVMGNRR